MDEESDNIPGYLKELDCSSPSSWRKLIAAWDGLNFESQIVFLSYIKRKNLYNPLRKDLFKMALESSNSYIRYLAAREFFDFAFLSLIMVAEDGSIKLKEDGVSKEDIEEIRLIVEKIRNDSNELVRNAVYECQASYDKCYYRSLEQNKNLFWHLSHEERLLFMKEDSDYSADLLLDIVKDAIESKIEQNSITWHEIDEILSEYIFHKNLKKFYERNGRHYADCFSMARGLKELWGIPPLLPSGIGKNFIKNLPTEDNYLFELKEETASQLTKHNLKVLLYRSDVKLSKLRKKIFFDPNEDSSLKWAAVSYNFDLSVDELLMFLKEVKESNRSNENAIISPTDLAFAAKNLSPWVYLALLYEHETDEKKKYNLEEIGWIQSNMNQRLESLAKEEDAKKYALARMKLYDFAKRVAEKEENKFEEFKAWLSNQDRIGFLAKYLISNDRWSLFKALLPIVHQHMEVISTHPYLYISKHLPLVPEIGEKDDIDWDELDDPKPASIKLEDFFSQITYQLKIFSRYGIWILILLILILFKVFLDG